MFFIFKKTTAHRRYEDDVPDDVKQFRLNAMSKAFREIATEINTTFVGKNQQILIEGVRVLITTYYSFYCIL